MARSFIVQENSNTAVYLQAALLTVLGIRECGLLSFCSFIHPFVASAYVIEHRVLRIELDIYKNTEVKKIGYSQRVYSNCINRGCSYTWKQDSWGMYRY